MRIPEVSEGPGTINQREGQEAAYHHPLIATLSPGVLKTSSFLNGLDSKRSLVDPRFLTTSADEVAAMNAVHVP